MTIASIAACSNTPTLPTIRVGVPTEAASADPLAVVPVRDNADALFRQAKEFDLYLSGKMDADQANELERTCHTRADENPFCYSVSNRDLLENQRATPSHATSATARSRSYAIRPRFHRHRITNWIELRFAPVQPLIRGFSSLRPSDFNQLRHLAARETHCPNNAAIAVAATLEDQLSEGLGYGEIASLYAKGGDCLVGIPADRENLLTRAGLFYFAKKDYVKAAAVLQKSAQIESVFNARPLYWLYRVRQQLKQTAKAREALELLTTRYPFSFHTLIALTSLGKDPGEVLKKSSARVTRSQQVQGVNRLIEQTELLRRFGFAQSAAKVLDWAILGSQQGVEPEVLLYLAELKRDQGDYHGKITILSDVLYKHPALVSRDTLELYFPKVFFPIFERQSPIIDPYLLIAVARRESAFRTGAVSGANARGLLQVLPETGRRFGAGSNLLDPSTNVEVGARYLTELLQKTRGQIHFALAAYNAGPAKLSTWTDRYPVDDPVLFTDLVPYRETREYVASVLRNYYWYRRIHQNDAKMTPRRILQVARTASNATNQ